MKPQTTATKNNPPDHKTLGRDMVVHVHGFPVRLVRETDVYASDGTWEMIQESLSNDSRNVSGESGLVTASDCHADRVAPNGGDSGRSDISVVKLDIENMPEMLSAMRRELANGLREEADAESDPRLQRKLRELAAQFEAGT